MQKNTGILYVTPFYPPDYAGGARLAHGVATKLSTDFKVLVLTKRQKVGSKPLISTDVFEDIEVTRVAYFGKSAIGKLLSIFLLMISMIRLSGKYKIIHFIGIPNEVFLLTLVGALLGKKMVSTMELTGDDDLGTIKRSTLGNLKLTILEAHSYIGALSQELIDTSMPAEKLKNRVIELPNAIEFDKYIPVSNEENLQKRAKLTPFNADDFVIVFCGAIGRRKGCDLILDFTIQNKAFITEKHLKFLLIGPVEDSDIGESLSRNSSVFMTGTVNPEHVIDYYQASDLFVFPSKREGFGRVALEARACGLVSLVSDIAPMRQITENMKTGVLFKSEDAADFSKKLIELINNQTLFSEIQAVSRQSIDNKYKMTDLIARHEKLYSALVSGEKYLG